MRNYQKLNKKKREMESIKILFYYLYILKLMWFEYYIKYIIFLNLINNTLSDRALINICL